MTVATPDATVADLPRWDMTVVYPGLDSAEFTAGFAAAVEAIDQLRALFDEEQVDRRPSAPLEAATVTAVERVISRFNAVLEQVETLSAYISAFVATDSRDDVAQARMSEFQQHAIQLSTLGTRFNAWIGSLDLDALLGRSEVARNHEFPLRQAAAAAAHQMSPEEEELAVELGPVAGSAWGKLHGNLTSQITVRLPVDGVEQDLPMSEVRNLAHHPDREVRRQAYEAELAAWSDAALPLAAAMNGIKGQGNALSRRRGWQEPLDEALFENHIDRATLDAMLGAAREAFPDLRRYLQAKARMIGVPALPWYDLFAPVGGSDRSWSFPEAVSFLEEQFGTYSDRMRGLVTRSVAERWIDAGPRAGKRDGAFCMSLRGDESRILANYSSGFDDVSTLAHELGHAYHNLNEAGLTPLQRETPMTLAETASTFCETIVREAVLASADAAERLAILEQSLQGSCQIVVDISSRFLFKQRVFAERGARDLSIDELNGIMLDAQKETYGDGLDPERLHPYMWAVKGHYYSAGRSFYNYPYMFGLLFGLGLYARYRESPERFRSGYDELLASTGRAPVAELATRFGIDIRSPEFWRSSLSIIRADVDRFEELTAGA